MRESVQMVLLALFAVGSPAIHAQDFTQRPEVASWWSVHIYCGAELTCLCVVATSENDALDEAHDWLEANCEAMVYGIDDSQLALEHGSKAACDEYCGRGVVPVPKRGVGSSNAWRVRVSATYCNGRRVTTYGTGCTYRQAYCAGRARLLRDPAARCGVRCWSACVLTRPCTPSPCRICRPQKPCSVWHRPLRRRRLFCR